MNYNNGTRSRLAPGLGVCKVINGMWQVAGGHGQIDHELAVSEMIRYHEAGFTTWDMADIYGPAEEIFGKFRHALAGKKGEDELSQVQGLTKFVPNSGPMTRSIVQYHIEKSLQRMNVDAIDLVQFHWWDYNNPSYMDALHHLSKLRDEGKIRHVGLTNFDTARMEEMVEHGFNLVSNQVQYSVLDQRPDEKMYAFCKKHGIKILAYGTVMGGFLSDKYLGVSEPSPQELFTLSLQKYKNMIDVWGGWVLFQELLGVLNDVAKKHHSSITNVATSFVADNPVVGGVIIGARLGISEHIRDNEIVFELALDEKDRKNIQSVVSKGQNLYEIIGDCGDEYR